MTKADDRYRWASILKSIRLGWVQCEDGELVATPMRPRPAGEVVVVVPDPCDFEAADRDPTGAGLVDVRAPRHDR